MSEIHDEVVLLELDTRAIDLALQALHRWTLAGIIDRHFQLNLKLSDSMLNDAAFPILLENQLATLGVLPAQIQLELPSTDAIFKDANINELRELGVSLALNGVSTEPNLLRHVPSIHPTAAIIGKPSLDDSVVLPHIMDVCGDLNVDVIARHVDTREQLARLHTLGVTHFQGEAV